MGKVKGEGLKKEARRGERLKNLMMEGLEF